MPEVDLYDNLADSYDLLIRWDRRLRRERPFFTRVFKEYGVRRILDTACGTGIHAIAFHDWGYYVVGTDISAPMVEKSRENAGERDIEFLQASFTELDKTGGLFDAVTCLGNSLPHVLTDEDLTQSLRCMYDALLPGGIIVIHGNNYDRVVARQERFMPLASGKRGKDEFLFVRFFDFHGDTLTFNVVTLAKRDGEWTMFPDASTHRALTRELLLSHLEKVGFVNPQVWGGYPDEPFDPLGSDNLIVVAQKPHNLASQSRTEPIKELDRIPILENGDPLLDVEEAAPEVEVRDPGTMLRKTVVEMLRKAASLLPEGYRLKVKAGLRLLSKQQEMYEYYCGVIADEHPDWPTSHVRRELNKYLAPPHAKHPPGHTTGGAVDLTVLGPDGEELDMDSAIHEGCSQWQIFPTYSKCVTPRAARNRQMLCDAMTAAGFSNYPGEYWHYSYGDNAWAYRVGAVHAVYGAAPEAFPCEDNDNVDLRG